MDMSKYKAMFISETAEHLQSMNQGLVTIEENPKDQDAVAEVFRNAHSIKLLQYTRWCPVFKEKQP